MNAYIVIPATILDQGKFSYHTDRNNFVIEMRIERALNTAITEQRLIKAGINAARLDELSKNIEMEKFNLRGEAEDRQRVASPLC